MARKPRPHTGDSPLPGSMIDLLLGGWDAVLTVHESRRRGIDDTYDGWAPLIDFHDHAAAWREHRAWLLGEWRRRGGKGQPWAVQEGFDDVFHG